MFESLETIDRDTSIGEFDDFRNKLMQYVDLYVLFPKPRGKGGAPVINECSNVIHNGMKVLARTGRIDLASQIFDKLIEGKDHLRGPSYLAWYEWMMKCFHAEKEGYCSRFLNENTKACEVYINEPRTSLRGINDIGGFLADENDKKAKEKYKALVLKLTNKIIDMDSDIHVKIDDNSEEKIIDDKKEKNPILNQIERLLENVEDK